MRLSSRKIILSSANIYHNRGEWTNILHTFLYMGLYKIRSKLYFFGLNIQHIIIYTNLLLVWCYHTVSDAWKLLPQKTCYNKEWRDSSYGCKSYLVLSLVLISVYPSICANFSLCNWNISSTFLCRWKPCLVTYFTNLALTCSVKSLYCNINAVLVEDHLLWNFFVV